MPRAKSCSRSEPEAIASPVGVHRRWSRGPGAVPGASDVTSATHVCRRPSPLDSVGGWVFTRCIEHIFETRECSRGGEVCVDGSDRARCYRV